MSSLIHVLSFFVFFPYEVVLVVMVAPITEKQGIRPIIYPKSPYFVEYKLSQDCVDIVMNLAFIMGQFRTVQLSKVVKKNILILKSLFS